MKRNVLIFLLGISIGAGSTAVGFYAYLPREVTEFSGKQKIKGQGNVMSIEQVKEQMKQDCEDEMERAVKAALKQERRSRRKKQKN